MPSVVNIRIDIRSSVSMIVFATIAISMTVFILIKAEEAIDEIQRLSNAPIYSSPDGQP